MKQIKLTLKNLQASLFFFLLANLFSPTKSFSQWTISPLNTTAFYCCNEEYEFEILPNAPANCDCISEINENNITVENGSVKSFNKLTSPTKYIIKVKFNCKDIVGLDKSKISIKCKILKEVNGKNVEEICELASYSADYIRHEPKIPQGFIKEIDCGQVSPFSLQKPNLISGISNPNDLYMEWKVTYVGGLSGTTTFDNNNNIQVIPESPTSTGSVFFTIEDKFCNKIASTEVKVIRKKPKSPEIPFPSNFNTSCPKNIWCFDSNSPSLEIEIPEVDGGVEYELLNFCAPDIEFQKNPNHIRKFTMFYFGEDLDGFTYPCRICVKVKNFCGLWSETKCYDIVITSEKPQKPLIILDNPNQEWWVCCPNLNLPNGYIEVSSNTCSLQTQIIGPDGKILNSDESKRFGGSFGTEFGLNNQTYQQTYCNPFSNVTFSVSVTASNCFGSETSTVGFTTLPPGDIRCDNQQHKTTKGKSDINDRNIRFDVEKIETGFIKITLINEEAQELAVQSLEGKLIKKENSSVILIEEGKITSNAFIILAKTKNGYFSQKYQFKL